MGISPENNGNMGPIVAIDGPVASGKTTVGRAAAQQLGLRFLDTGIMYRAVTWLALKLQVDADDAEAVGKLAEDCLMSLESSNPVNLIALNGHALTASDLASDPVDRNVSAVAASSRVRRALVAQQRTIAAVGGIVMVGRDIGSVVLTDADVKVYVDAPPEERARRRFLQQSEIWDDVGYQKVLADTIKRDKLDSQRSDSPLTVPADAVVIDTERMDFEQSVEAVVSAIRSATRVSMPAKAPRR